MSARSTAATAARVLGQLRRDPRTLALVLAVPCLLLVLLNYLFDDQPQTFERIGVPLIGIFPLVQMFVVTSVTMLRERTSGTLERLMASPLGKLDVLAGYAGAFGLLGAVQGLLVAAFGLAVLGLESSGPEGLIVALAILNGVLGMAMGLFVSAFARTEFQAVQFMPAFVLPQLLLCGLFVAPERMAPLLETIGRALPATYAYDAFDRVARTGSLGAGGAADVAVILGVTALALGLGAATLRRRTA